ncbi:hypothetical protein BKA01_005228 [Pseudonocardia eucalypti]|uniref:hypothetical protein n=1 Tax=Pseudonocardia eucalypti TaxID=648755 RepID=UPI00185D896D|nr:hypothetical protein [Pseudonocardia eucalypti]
MLNTEQLRYFGVSRSAITANVRAGRWQCVAPRVYATFTGPLTHEARVAAALSYAGPSGLLSHQTAAELWHMHPLSDGPVHVTVPYGCSAVSQPPLVVIHRSRAFRHIAVVGVPPLTSRPDTVIDLAVAEPTARLAMRTLTTLVTARRAAAASVRERLEQRPPRRYRQALRTALDRIQTGVHSPLEELYAVDVEAAHGIPSARRQEPLMVDGRKLIEDAVYDNIGIPLTVRLDGASHLAADVAHRDRRRDNVAEVSGRSRLQFGWAELSRKPCAAAVEVAQVLWRRGWVGPLRACPRARECGVTL